MALKPKRPPAEGEFLFEIDPEPLEECVTSLGGVPLVVRTARSLGVPGGAEGAGSGLSRRTALQAKGFPKTHFFSCGSICPKSRPKALPRRSAAARRSLDHLDTGFCGINP